MEIGDKVLYLKTMKALDFGEIGFINYIGRNFISIIYPQNEHKNKVYAHSARLCDVKILKSKDKNEQSEVK